MTRRTHKTGVEAATKQILVNLDDDLIAWLDYEAEVRDRSRTWLVNHICKMYRGNLLAERKRRAVRREMRSREVRGKAD